MKFEEFVTRVQKLSVIDSGILLPGIKDPDAVKVQLARWVKAGKLIQLRRGIYVLAEPYRKVEVFEPFVAFSLVQPSYISLEKSLEYYDLIPEAVHTYTSVTTKRPIRFETPLGIYDYRHIRTSLFWGYESIKGKNQTAFMAAPEKALLDIIYLKHIKVTFDYLDGLRLQNFSQINLTRLIHFGERFNKPGMIQAAKTIKEYIQSQKRKFKSL